MADDGVHSAVPRHSRHTGQRRARLHGACAACVLGALPPVMASLVGAVLAPQAAIAQAWNPFDDGARTPPGPRRDTRAADSRPVAPREDDIQADAVPSARSQPWGAAQPPGVPQKVESTDLAPLTDGDRAVPAGPARADAGEGIAGPAAAAGRVALTGGFDPAVFGPLIAALAFPSRSPAMTSLLRRLLAGPDALLGGAGFEQIALRAEALYRAGHVGEALALMPARVQAGDNPVLAALVARVALAAGEPPRACEAVKVAMAARAQLPEPLKSEVLVAQAYCGAVAGNPGAAELAASLAREEKAGTAETLAILDAVAADEAPHFDSFKRVGVLDYRLAQSIKAPIATLPVDRAEPALLAVLVRATDVPPKLRLEAAEAAARLNVIDGAALAAAYREQSATPAEQAERPDAAMHRSLLLRAAEAERTPSSKTRFIRNLLDDARHAGLYEPVAAALTRAVEDVQSTPEISWFAETAVEILLIGGHYDKARAWTRAGAQSGSMVDRSGGLGHWLALIDIADPAQASPRGESLGIVEEMALRGRFTPAALHRLAGVLDALDYDVPHRLWEAASRGPQPAAGYLPQTGVLPELQEVSKKRDLARTILMVFKTLGPSAEGAHLIALGDAIRALKRVGLEREARQIGLEALLGAWPRVVQG